MEGYLLRFRKLNDRYISLLNLTSNVVEFRLTVPFIGLISSYSTITGFIDLFIAYQ